MSREAEALLINMIFYESHSKHMSIHGDIGGLLRNDGCVNQFKMTTCSTNPLSKDNLDDTSISAAATEALTDI